MSRVFLTGDTHGQIDMKRLSCKNWPEGRKLTKSDYLIVLGDFGLLWNHEVDDTEIYWTTWLNEKPWTTLFVDGNHEHHLRLAQLETIEMFGSEVGKVSDSIFHLKRGNVYIIEGKKYFAFGGAQSIDKESRIDGISWWKEEVASHAEMNKGLENLEKHNKVDYILAHTGPNEIVKVLIASYGLLNLSEDQLKDPTQLYLEEVCKLCDFKHFYCGHFHEDWDYGKYRFMFKRIKKL